MSYADDRTWWGYKRWRMAFAALTKAVNLTEDAVRGVYQTIVNGTFEDKTEEFKDYIDAQYRLADEPASFIRAGLFSQTVAEFEYSLLFLCADGSRIIAARKYEWTNIRSDIVKSRLALLGELCGCDFLCGSEILELQAIRNLFMHTVGETLSLTHERRELLESRIGAWTRIHPDLANISIAGVRVRPEFVAYSLAYYDKFMVHLVSRLSLKADEVLAARAANK